MKKTLLFIVSLALMPLFHTPFSHAAGKGNEGNINNNSNSVTNQITVNTSVTTEIANAVMVTIQEYAGHIKREVTKACAVGYHFTKNLFANHKWKFIVLGTTGSYGSLVASNLYIAKELQQPQRWFYWKHHLSLEELLAIPQSELGHDLVAEIQRRYTSPTAPTDFITPFVLFMKDIEYDQKMITTYQNLGNCLEKIYLTDYTWYDRPTKERCDEWLKRVALVKSIFLNWMANYKINQHVKQCIRASRFFLTPWEWALRLNIYL
ncbi:TPA: hypothetical protein DDZ86_00305 [Candidatus Dependentiae bacterium]|nr:MAG: hypothetical protein UW09_C0002G0061 [candidate division TM6 bacterium GW2011_GWF2_43_87]HBL98070.1 hypothetical protein [Candidatus Dependentiae bacterium]